MTTLHVIDGGVMRPTGSSSNACVIVPTSTRLASAADSVTTVVSSVSVSYGTMSSVYVWPLVAVHCLR